MLNNRGVSLIESLLVVVIVGIMVLLMVNLPNAMALITHAKYLSLAREIAAKQIEDERTVGFVNLASGASPVNDSRMSLLPFGSGTLTVEDCDEQICTNLEAIKQVSVTISWKENNKPQSVKVKTMIGEGGIN